MATRNQVLSLFGASPEQIMQQEAMRQAEMVQSIRDPYQQVGTAIGVGLGRLFGGKSAELRQSEQMREAMQGVDFSNAEELRNLAKTVSAFAPETSLRLLSEANKLDAPVYQDVKLQVMEPEFDALGRKVGEKPKTITRTGVFKGGVLTGYVDGQGGVTPIQSETTIGVMDSPEAQASRASVTTSSGTDLGDGAVVRLKTDGKTPITDDQRQAAEAEANVIMNVTPEAAQRIEMQQGPRGGSRIGDTVIDTVEQREPITVPPTITSEEEASSFTETPLEARDRAMRQLANEDNAKLLRMKKALEAQLTLTNSDQEVLRIITSILADRKRAPEQKQR